MYSSFEKEIMPYVKLGFLIAKCGFNWLVEQGNLVSTGTGSMGVQNQQVPLFSMPVMLLCILVSFLTVALALRKPMKIVSRISPIEATRYLENAETHKKGKRNGRKNVTVFSMAMANVTGNSKRTIGTILTMGFSCVLFVIISNYVGNIDTEHETRLSVNHGQFELQLDYSAEYDERYPENNLDMILTDDPLNDSLIKEIKSIPGVTDVMKNIYVSAEKGEFVIEDGIEDVHSQVELMLTRKLGDVGKKIHSGRSRNDQVLVDLKLFTRTQLKEVAEAVEQLFHVLISQSNRYKDVLMPGYTHLQIAMPSSFGLWFGAYAESLVDDMMLLQAAFKMCNRNPLGSAAGYGSSFPLNREMTTRLLGFDSMNYNVVYAQMGRGKMERNVAFALASIAGTVSKLAFDACMFSSQNFGFVKLPDECTTGSSIMPHKKNPDVFELTRAKCNKIQALPQQIMMIMNNLPSGYFRDLQIIKEVFLPAFQELKDCLQMTTYIMDKIKVNEHILDDDRYLYIFSVEEVNRLAAEGMPFRDAYKKVGLDIEAGKFTHNKQVHHTHEGSIGNLCNDKIILLMEKVVDGFNFSAMEQAEKSLLDR